MELKIHNFIHLIMKSGFTIKLVLGLAIMALAACSAEDVESNISGDEDLASIHIRIPGVARENNKTWLNRLRLDQAVVPAEVDSIIIDVLNVNAVLLDSAEIISSGEATLNIPEGRQYTVRGRAFSGSEILFSGETQIAEILSGTNLSVSLTLEDQIQFTLSSMGNVEVGSSGEDISFDLAGLNNTSITWYVNGVEGGNSQTGSIDDAGRYSPPATLPQNTRIEITAEPTLAPSFAQTFSFDLIATTVVTNQQPQVNAGNDASVDADMTVELNALSSDADGTITSYNWLWISGDFTPVLSNANTANASFSAPSIQFSGTATFQITVTNNQGLTATDSVSISVNGTDQPIVASAGANQNVIEADIVSLDASGSNDPDNAITYVWTQLSGKSVSISNATTSRASFVAPAISVDEDLLFQVLISNDAALTATDRVTISVARDANNRINPVSIAGLDQTVNVGDTVNLNGSATDADGTIVSYLWALVQDCPCPIVTNVNQPSASFVAPAGTAANYIEYRLIVTDNEGDFNSDTIRINITAPDAALVANAGIDQTLTEGALVALDASESNDPDNAISTYLWQQTAGTTTILSDVNAILPTFTALDVSADEDVIFRLTVTNDAGLTATDQVTIRVLNTVADKIYFAATDVNLEPTLWITDGTTVNTIEADFAKVRNRDFNSFRTVDNYFYYRSYDSATGFNPRLKGIEGSAPESIVFVSTTDQNIRGMQVLNNYVLFAAMNNYLAPDGDWQYISYNIAGGAPPISTMFTYGTTSQVDVFEETGVLNGYVYFAYNAWPDNTLYRTDGVNPAQIVKTSIPGGIFGTGNIIRDFTQVGNQLYFVAANTQLWKTDGTDAGTLLVKTFSGAVGSDSSYATLDNTIAFNGELYFTADDGDGRELWKTSGSLATTIQVSNLDASAASSNPQNFILFNGELYFFCSGNSLSNGLWKTSGTAATTVRVSDLLVGYDIYRPDVIGEAQGRPAVVSSLNLLFFVASDDGAGREELWVTDGSSLNTRKVVDTRTGFSANIDLLKSGSNYLIFSGIDDDNRAKLWRTDGVTTTLLKDICISCFENATFDGPATGGDAFAVKLSVY